MHIDPSHINLVNSSLKRATAAEAPTKPAVNKPAAEEAGSTATSSRLEKVQEMVSLLHEMPDTREGVIEHARAAYGPGQRVEPDVLDATARAMLAEFLPIGGR
ncbi:MAG: hypothetical protein ACOCVG_02800 [Verrucomicrobiota bacterium]